MTGVYHSLDTPAALRSQIQTAIPLQHSSEFDFNSLYTFYSTPNVILPSAGGYFVDRLGSSLCLVLFPAFCWMGLSVFAFKLAVQQWHVMWLGCFVYELGGEGCVTYLTLLSKWFMEEVRLLWR